MSAQTTVEDRRSRLSGQAGLPALHGRVTLKQGGGGRAMRALIEKLFVREFAAMPFDGVGLAAMDDGAAIPIGSEWLIVTTDSHVIHPIFFPGGDIGRISISGTVNDLAMMGATRLLGITCGLILEEGFPLDQLERVQRSLVDTCIEAGTLVITGDTKVMGRGEIDGIVINTTGVALAKRVVRDNGLRAGDRIVVTGTMGDHGLAVMSARHGLQLEGDLVSDVAPIHSLIATVLEAMPEAITAMKDPTRGGLSSALHEMAQKSNVGIILEERNVPVTDAVRAAGEILGIDPLHVANEGKAVIGVRAEDAERLVALLRAHPLGRDAAIAGTCIAERPGGIILDTGFGRRLLAEPEGEPLPRIC
ncbi:MAG TPA: hydrogenase expression/formation protein HypE [Thermoanaerobaculia bacterium]|nr:hydrogenase expression/formation protein HypE [Thermoanaerobaculia bacterium]